MSQGLKAVLDPEEAPLELVLASDGKSGYAMLSPLKKATPQSEPQWASNIDTEGELSAGSKAKNIEIVPKLRMLGRSEEDFRERQLALEQKLNKMGDEGGTFRLYYPDGSWIDYEVRAVTGGERLFDNSFIANWRTEDEITFVCAPFGNGEEYLAGEFSGSDRLLEGLVKDVPGTATALARAEIVSPKADVWELIWGRESRALSTAATALPYYLAKVMTPLAGATIGTRTIEGKSGVSVVKKSLSPNWSGQLLTDLGSESLTHIGVFEVYAWINMPAANNGEVGIGLDYGVGDLTRRTTLAPVYFPANHPREGHVVRVSLGQVFLPAHSEPKWQGQINTRSTNSGDECDILAVGLRPLAEGNGRIAVSPTLDQPASLLSRDEFNQKPGPLNGQVLAAAQSISGPKSPGTVADGTRPESVPWTNVEAAKAPGGGVASATVGAGVEPFFLAATHYLKGMNFGFELPNTATIEGLLVEVAAVASPSPGGAGVTYPIKGGVVDTSSALSGPASAFSSARFAYYTYGSSFNLIGKSWLYSDINASDFGMAFVAIGHEQTIEVDHIRATVYWTDTEGQKWATTGDATDLVVESAGHTAQRSEHEDAGFTEGRWAIAGSTGSTDVVVGVNAKHGALSGVVETVQAVTARYVDSNNFLLFGFRGVYTGQGAAFLCKRVGGAITTLAEVAIPETTEWHTLRLQVDRRGRYFCWLSYVESGVVKLLAQGQDPDMATGGALASGKAGFSDAGIASGTGTRNYDQFVVWIPPLQAAAYEGLGLKLASDRVERQGPNGAWSPITPEGDYLKLAPAGLEGRKNRLVLIASPHDPDTMPVGFPTELRAAVYVTPRYRGVPDPA